VLVFSPPEPVLPDPSLAAFVDCGSRGLASSMGAGNVKAAKPQPPPLRLPVDAHHHAPRELLHPSKPVHHIADLVPLPAVVKSPVSKAWQVTCNVHRGIICRFCGGKSCKREDFTKQPDTPAIHGLHSTWVSANVLGMQRPSSRLIKQYNIIDQFKKAGVGAIVNLQLAGEHPVS
jgi:hypothetical protein